MLGRSKAEAQALERFSWLESEINVRGYTHYDTLDLIAMMREMHELQVQYGFRFVERTAFSMI